jgi:hypothetical protein
MTGKKTGESDLAGDLISRAVFAFESLWPPNFDPTICVPNIDYQVEENRAFFLALFRYIQLLGR